MLNSSEDWKKSTDIDLGPNKTTKVCDVRQDSKEQIMKYKVPCF